MSFDPTDFWIACSFKKKFFFFRNEIPMKFLLPLANDVSSDIFVLEKKKYITDIHMYQLQSLSKLRRLTI